MNVLRGTGPAAGMPPRPRRSVVRHVLARLRDIGITDVFGVPGEASFPLCDAVCDDPAMRWIGCSSALNAAYAADGYARVRGAGVVCTTHGAGELGALPGLAGAHAEHLPLFHLVGVPAGGAHGPFRGMAEPILCAQATMTPENVAEETERMIAAALHHRHPVRMEFPADQAGRPAQGEAQPWPVARSEAAALEAAAAAVLEALAAARTACVLPGILLARAGLQPAMQAVLNASGLPFATMFMDKAVLDERQPAYVGMYDARLMGEEVRDFVEGADCVLAVGTLGGAGAFTARLDPARTIAIAPHHARVGGRVFEEVEMGDLLATLAARAPWRSWRRIVAGSLGPVTGVGASPITAAALYTRWAEFLRPGDIVVAETGTVSMGIGVARLPAGAGFQNQTLWGATGWATPAAFGAAVAAPGARVVLLTGDGAHQATAQEVGQFGRYGLKPVIFVLNNDGYLLERLLCRDPGLAYNDVAAWHYAELPRALGCEGWLAERAATCAELDLALARAGRAAGGAYVEVVTGAYAAAPLAMRLHEAVKSPDGSGAREGEES